MLFFFYFKKKILVVLVFKVKDKPRPLEVLKFEYILSSWNNIQENWDDGI
jgi:hypothetical protein